MICDVFFIVGGHLDTAFIVVVIVVTVKSTTHTNDWHHESMRLVVC